jgi:hypothetical protein
LCGQQEQEEGKHGGFHAGNGTEFSGGVPPEKWQPARMRLGGPVSRRRPPVPKNSSKTGFCRL